jgi:hypothetical protein
MDEKDIKDISIQDLDDEAQVARSTFYSLMKISSIL